MKEQKINLFVACRFLIGVFFIVSGAHKLLSPQGNFLYVVQSYDILPSALEKLAAAMVPWVEYLTGIFIVLGLWLRPALQGLRLLLIVFILIVSQAILRHLPLEECGCFGELFSLPLRTVLFMDTALLLFASLLVKNIEKIKSLSLDSHFEIK